MDQELLLWRRNFKNSKLALLVNWGIFFQHSQIVFCLFYADVSTFSPRHLSYPNPRECKTQRSVYRTCIHTCAIPLKLKFWYIFLYPNVLDIFLQNQIRNLFSVQRTMNKKENINNWMWLKRHRGLRKSFKATERVSEPAAGRKTSLERQEEQTSILFLCPETAQIGGIFFFFGGRQQKQRTWPSSALGF